MAPLALRFMWARALPVLLVLALGTASAAAPPKPPAPPPISCEAVVSLGTAWVSTQGNTSYTTLNLNIINKAAAILAVPWTLTLKSAGYGNIRQVQAVPSSSRAIAGPAAIFWQVGHCSYLWMDC